MPFKIFHRHRKDSSEVRSRSKSCMDLYEDPSDEPPDLRPTIFTVEELEQKSRRKRSLPAFHLPKWGNHSNKHDNHVSFKGVKKDKALEEFLKNKSKSIAHLNENSEIKQLEPVTVKQKENIDQTPTLVNGENSTPPLRPSVIENHRLSHSGSDHRQYVQQHGGDSRNHFHPRRHHSEHRQRSPKKSASCGAHMESMGRERRMSDIAQLDNYIEYLRRTNTDDGNMASRLCCAQVLRMGFVRLEQKHVHDSLHHSSTHGSLSHSPPRDFPNGHGHGRHVYWNKDHEWENSVDGEEASDQLEDSDSNGSPINVVCSPDQDSDDKTSDHDSPAVPDSDDSDDTPGMWKKSKRLTTRKTHPCFPVDIEIF